MGVATLLTLSLGGILTGLAAGLVCIFCINICTNHLSHQGSILQLTLTVTCAYASFYIAEHEASCSGVLSVVFAAIVVARMGWPLLLSPALIRTFWHTVEFLGNTVIFFLAGTIVGEVFVHRTNIIKLEDWFWLFVLYSFTLLIRCVMLLL